MTWTDDHGEDGLRRKFDVYKPRDRRDDIALTSCQGCNGTPCPGICPFSPQYSGPLWSYRQSDRIGADGEFIFVLRPESDQIAWYLMCLYAERVAYRAPKLADDIKRELHKIRLKNERNTD